jgi:precorrin-4 methylase
VGYGRPPCHTRFVKGQSGNPRGRPPGAKNLSTLLSEALNETVIVTENGGRRKVTKRQAIITQLVNRSATADFRAIKILLDIVRDIERQTEPSTPEASDFSEADEKVIEQLRARFSKGET